MRRICLLLAVCCLVLGADDARASSPPDPRTAAVFYRPPIAGELVIVHPYVAPASPYAAGERGVDLAAVAGGAVVAAGDGRVTFAGAVAGRGVVVLIHPDGISTEYEPVVPAVHAGQAVVAGTVLGVIGGTHPGCPPDACLHWGARRGQLYLDPMSLLEPLGVVRLLPWR